LDTTHVARDQIAMSSVVLAEVVYLIEKGWIDTAAFDRILAALNRVKPDGSPDGSPMRLRQHGTLFTFFTKNSRCESFVKKIRNLPPCRRRYLRQTRDRLIHVSIGSFAVFAHVVVFVVQTPTT